MNYKITHIGWVTTDLARFEDFWCKGLGFKKVWEAQLMGEKVRILFGVECAAMAIRYEREGDTIEVHVFNPPAEKYADSQDFNRFGINHIALHVDGPRDQFVKELSEKVQYLEIRRFHDPSGWDNIFIRDYEGNWIELREAL